MKITYSVTVCNESKELYSLLAFLKKVKDPEDDINVLLDTAHCTPNVRHVLKHFEEDVVLNERDFDGNFADHRNYHISTCSGDYIFMIDADEMPQEDLVKNIKQVIQNTDGDAFMVPRINIHPGYTKEWLEASKFQVNEMGWINWPDYNCRIIKNVPERIKFAKSLHEMITGHEKIISIRPTPDVAVWHIKSVEKQDNRWDDGEYVVPGGDNLYDTLM
jgi:hypothetical protein